VILDAYFYSAPLEVRSIVIVLSVCVRGISVEPLDRYSQNFVCSSSVAVARSSSGGVAIPGRSLMSMNALCYPLCEVQLTTTKWIYLEFL